MPGIILAQALACITDARGTIQVPEWRPPFPQSVRRVLQGVEVDGGEDGPTVDRDWGEPDLTPAERVFGWNSFEILAFTTGTPDTPGQRHPGQGAGALPASLRGRHRTSTRSSRRCAVTSTATASPRSRSGAAAAASSMPAGSIRTILGSGGRLRRSNAPRDTRPRSCPTSADRCRTTSSWTCSGLKTIWVPHSYAGCSQHAPDEHMLAPIAREGLGLMAGLFWDLGETGEPALR